MEGGPPHRVPEKRKWATILSPHGPWRGGVGGGGECSGSGWGGEGDGGKRSKADDATIAGTTNTITHVCCQCAWGKDPLNF